MPEPAARTGPGPAIRLPGRTVNAAVARFPWAWRLAGGPVRRFFDSIAPRWDERVRIDSEQHRAPLIAALDRLEARPSRILGRQDLTQVVLSIREGRLSSTLLLRRLGIESRKNNVYKAFRELGRVIRTITLLRFISEPELREEITAATNKAEAYNGFSAWLRFGHDAIERNDPAAQAARPALDRVDRFSVPLRDRGARAAQAFRTASVAVPERQSQSPVSDDLI